MLDQYCTTSAAARQQQLQAGSAGRAAATLRPFASPGPPTGKRTREVLAADDPADDLAASATQKAHQGACVGLMPTPDGLHWVSAGTDSRLRLWDSLSWHNRLVSFPDTPTKGTRAKRMAVSDDGKLLFTPLGNNVQVT